MYRIYYMIMSAICLVALVSCSGGGGLTARGKGPAGSAESSQPAFDSAGESDFMAPADAEMLRSLGYINGEMLVYDPETGAYVSSVGLDASGDGIAADSLAEAGEDSDLSGVENEDAVSEAEIEGEVSAELEQVDDGIRQAPSFSFNVQSRQILPGTGLIPEGWPADIPITPGFDVRYSSSDDTGLKLVAFGDLPIDEVENFYINLEGWHQLADIDKFQDRAPALPVKSRVVVVLIRNEKVLTVDIVETEEDTVIQLLYTSA